MSLGSMSRARAMRHPRASRTVSRCGVRPRYGALRGQDTGGSVKSWRSGAECEGVMTSPWS